MENEENLLKSNFMSWQCRIRQIAMREDEGRPSSGMCPKLTLLDGEVLSEHLITMIIREDSAESTDFFRFQVQKNNDPQEVRKKVLTFLQSTHYHGPREFMDGVTALFGEASPMATKLLEEGKCILQFSQFSQGYRLHCNVEKLEHGDEAHDATLWHNRCFSPNLSDNVSVLRFKPDWDMSQAL
jgi:hypothetical protein